MKAQIFLFSRNAMLYCTVLHRIFIEIHQHSFMFCILFYFPLVFFILLDCFKFFSWHLRRQFRFHFSLFVSFSSWELRVTLFSSFLLLMCKFLFHFTQIEGAAKSIRKLLLRLNDICQEGNTFKLQGTYPPKAFSIDYKKKENDDLNAFVLICQMQNGYKYCCGWGWKSDSRILLVEKKLQELACFSKDA